MINFMTICFRSHAIALTTDIDKAFLQIGIAQQDRDYLIVSFDLTMCLENVLQESFLV